MQEDFLVFKSFLMVVRNFLKLFIIVFILLYCVGLCPWPLVLRHTDKPFGYLIFPKSVIFPRFLVIFLMVVIWVLTQLYHYCKRYWETTWNLKVNKHFFNSFKGNCSRGSPHLMVIMLSAKVRHKFFKYLNLSFLKISDNQTYHVSI